ncbi:MAG: RND family transporter [Salibacteraceae bacterium]
MYRGAAKIALVTIAVLTLASAGLLTNISFDYDFESFFPTDDPDLDFYLDYREEFEPDNDFVLIAITSATGVFNEEFLHQIDTLTQQLDTLQYIESTTSPTNAGILVVGPLGPIEVPFIHLNQPERYAKDSMRVYETEWLRNTLFSEDQRSVCIVLQTTPRLSKEKSDVLVYGMKDILSQYTFERIRVTGKVEGQQYFIEKIKWELAVFMAAGVVLLTIFLFVAFRSFWGIWVPILVVALSAIWLLGFMALTGKPVDAMVTLLPTILIVVGMSDVVHILSRYLEELRNGKAKLEAIKVSFREVGMATFLTSVTTAIGFFTMLTSSIRPIREFGLYTGVGGFLAFILAFTLLPSLLLFFKKPKIARKTNDGLFWHQRMQNIFAWSLRNRKAVLAGGMVAVCISLWGISMVKIDNYLLGDLQDKDPHKQDFLFFEHQFSGVRPFEMAVEVQDTSDSILDFDVLQEMHKIETYLQSDYGLGFIVSPISLVKSANQAMHGGKAEFYRFPESEKEYKKIKRVIQQLKKNQIFRAYFTEDQRRGRISGKITDLGSHEINKMNAEMDTQ